MATKDEQFISAKISQGLTKDDAYKALDKVKGFDKKKKIESGTQEWYEKDFGQLMWEAPGAVVRDVGETVGGFIGMLGQGAQAAGETVGEAWSLATDPKKQEHYARTIEEGGGFGEVVKGAGEMVGEVGGAVGGALAEEYIAPEGVNQLEFLAKRGLNKPFSTFLDVAGGAGTLSKLSQASKVGKLGSTAQKVATAASRAGQKVEALSIESSINSIRKSVMQGSKKMNIENMTGMNSTKLAKTQGRLNTWLNETVSSKLMNSYIKSKKNDFNFGKDPGLAITKEGIIANSRKELFTKVSQKKIEVGAEIGQKLDDFMAKNPTATVDLQPAFKALRSKIDDAAKGGPDQKALFNRLNDFYESITKEFDNVGGKITETGTRKSLLDVGEAHALKQEVGGRAKWANQAFDHEANQARVSFYRHINNEIKNKVDGIGGVQDRYSNLLTAEKALDASISQAAGKIGTFSDVALGAGAIAGGGIFGGIGMMAMKKFMGSAAFRTRASLMTQKLTRQGVPKNMASKMAKQSVIKEFMAKGYGNAQAGAQKAGEVIGKVGGEVAQRPAQAIGVEQVSNIGQNLIE